MTEMGAKYGQNTEIDGVLHRFNSGGAYDHNLIGNTSPSPACNICGHVPSPVSRGHAFLGSHWISAALHFRVRLCSSSPWLAGHFIIINKVVIYSLTPSGPF